MVHLNRHHACKTKTIGKVAVPDEFFFDYLRGEFDGDGSSHAYWDTRWHSSVSLYIRFCCASDKHLEWMRHTIERLIRTEGVLGKTKRSSVRTLEFSKAKAWPLYQAMYYKNGLPFLSRKKEKLDRQWQALQQSRRGIVPNNFIRSGKIATIT